MVKYAAWKLQKYKGIMAVDPTFWRYQTQTQFVLTKGLALEMAVAKCKETLEILSTFRSGRSGPVEAQSAYKAMCKPVCMQLDVMSQDALKFTGCSCSQLSTQPDEASYHLPNDWCLQNTGRMLCNILGFCGIWNCRIDDFMCPRYEWNKKIIPLKGPGSCLRGKLATNAGFSPKAAVRGSGVVLLIVLLAALLLLL